MALPIAKYPKFLSASSLLMYKNMPITFYLNRMSPEPIDYSLSPVNTKATSLGTAIDSYIKLHILKVFDWHDRVKQRMLNAIFDKNLKNRHESENTSLEKMMYGSIPETDQEQIVLGKAIGAWYVSTPMFRSICESLFDIEFYPMFHITIPIMDFGAIEIPIYCKLDAIVKYEMTDIHNNNNRAEPMLIPLDFKSTSTSPKPKYFMLYDKATPTTPSHFEYHSDVTFREIDESWDSQLTTYHMALQYLKQMNDKNNMGYLVDVTRMLGGLPAMIEQICIGSSVRVARYIAKCGSPTTLYHEYASMWLNIHNGTFVKGLIDNRTLLEFFARSETFY